MKRRYIDEIILKSSVEKSSYTAKIAAVKYLQKKGSLPINADVTFFVGENGTGKSTLIEAIAVACGFNPEGGSKNFNFSTAKDGEQFYSDLWRHLTISRIKYPKDGFFLRAESFFNAASYVNTLRETINAYGGVSLHDQSHGESFLALVHNRFFGKGLYILDEPEAALSPMRLMDLIAEIDRLVKDDSQFIIATHSPILMAYPGAEVLLFSDKGIAPVNYKDTEHYRITKRFINDPEQMMKYLTEDYDEDDPDLRQ